MFDGENGRLYCKIVPRKEKKPVRKGGKKRESAPREREENAAVNRAYYYVIVCSPKIPEKKIKKIKEIPTLAADKVASR